MLHAFLDDVTDPLGVFFLPARFSEAMRIPMSHLARIAKVHRNSLSQHPDPGRPRLASGRSPGSSRPRPIFSAATPPKRSSGFCHQPLSGFEGQTAEELVAEGHTQAVLAHLETLRDGGYA